jgi:hypothetical protein
LAIPVSRHLLALENLVNDCLEVAQAFVNVARLHLLLALSAAALDVL